MLIFQKDGDADHLIFVMIFPIAALPLAYEPIETGVDHLPLEGIDQHALNDTLLQLATDQYLVIMPKVFYLRLTPF